jgi:hypothetical protein
MAKSWKPTENDVVPTHPPNLRSKLVQTLGILHATINDAFPKLGFVTETMTALTIPMKIKIAPLLPVPVRISDAPPEDVFPIHSVVMVTMTAETDLMSKIVQIKPAKKTNFVATMEGVSPILGNVTERMIVAIVQTKVISVPKKLVLTSSLLVKAPDIVFPNLGNATVTTTVSTTPMKKIVHQSPAQGLNSNAPI